MQGLIKHNDGIKYLLSVIDVFSQYLHFVPLKSNTGPSVMAAFHTILKDRRYSKILRRRQVWLHTDRGKEFSRRPFQVMLEREGIQFHVSRNPDVKCAFVERVHRTLTNKLYRYFTYKNTYRFISVLQQFVKAYNTVRTAHGMAPAAVTDKHVLDIWIRMRSRVRVAKVKFFVGQHFRISKEKIKFAKLSEQDYTDEIFGIVTVIRRTPRPAYELQDLKDTLIEGQFYEEELTPVLVSKRSIYKIDKILDKS